MSRARSALAAIGVLAVVVGMSFVVAPSFAAILTVPRVALMLVGAIALVEGLRSIRTRRNSDIAGAEVPDPEPGIEPPVPGEEFDRLVIRWSTWRDHRRITNVDNRVLDRLRDAAIRAVMNRDAVSRREAEREIEEGTWTDDPVAAGFLSPTLETTAPLQVQLRGLMRAGSVSRFYVTRAVEAIAAAVEDR